MMRACTKHTIPQRRLALLFTDIHTYQKRSDIAGGTAIIIQKRGKNTLNN
ncbi:hypothetical protein HMPREF0733_10702 [Rothia dentocariosa ATCC 17931]|uniref:Uncharacterized protein n=1 Tax=Rothia dentocariosa (strain ATCC 17931 / CDC X599 / XDIA) TaxID=762948 RepID=E3H1U7_ROTDC|nr:hypothetical protein HMPREF0733_10702 [Rothia dentocariosa ATCC 17931]